MRKYLTPFIVAAILVGVGGLDVAWYLVSPLFINVQVNEALPVAATIVAQEPAAMKTAMAQKTTTQINEAMPAAAAPKLIAQGDFYNVVHEGKGKAEILRQSDGSLFLRLEDFQVLNGPDLHVYLAPGDKVATAIGQDIPGYTDLGKLKGNVGAQNYSIPSNVDVSQVHLVIIWCQPFKVPFIAARLK